MATCAMSGRSIDTDAQDRAVIAALDATGIPWRSAAYPCCRFIILPRSNFRPFTLAEESALMASVQGMPFGLQLDGAELRPGIARTTRRIMRADRTVCTLQPGKGFRIYSDRQ